VPGLCAARASSRSAVHPGGLGRGQEPETPSLQTWIAFLHDALADGLTPHVGLMVHWGYDVEAAGFERVSIEDADENFLDSMKENVLYCFEAGV
jgi:hypothetical protein